MKPMTKFNAFLALPALIALVACGGIQNATFSANPEIIEYGQESTLTWTADGAESIQIDNGVGVVTGKQSVTVKPSVTTTYTLTATKGIQNQTRSTQVKVKPGILKLEAVPASIAAGQKTVLSWETIGAKSVTLDGKVVDSKDSLEVSPTQTTTYKLLATNDAGTLEKSVTVTVAAAPQKPVIESFSADKTTLKAGESAILSWKTTGAATVTLNGEAVSATGTQTVTPATTTTYTLLAENQGQQAKQELTLTVASNVVLPTIKDFRSTKANYAEGEDIVLNWTAEKATQLILISMELGKVDVTGLQTYTYKAPAAGKYSFALAAYPADPATGKPLLSTPIIVTVSAPTASIDTFQSTATSLIAGESATLNWGTTNATKVTLNDGAQDIDVTGKTELSVKPSITTTYTLIAERGTQKVTRQLSIQVMSFKIDAFKADKTALNPGEKALLSWTIRGSHDKAVINDGSQDTDVTGKTSLEVTPEKSTVYKLSVYKGQEVSSQTLKITFGGLSYTDPASGSFRLVKNASLSSGERVVLDLVGDPSESTRGVAFYLQVDPEMAAWAPVSDTDGALVQFVALDPTKQGRALLIGKADKGLLQVGIFQKGAGAALQCGPDVVLARIAISPQGAKSGQVALSALKGKATSLQADASLKAIEISLGQLERK